MFKCIACRDTGMKGQCGCMPPAIGWRECTREPHCNRIPCGCGGSPPQGDINFNKERTPEEISEIIFNYNRKYDETSQLP